MLVISHWMHVKHRSGGRRLAGGGKLLQAAKHLEGSR